MYEQSVKIDTVIRFILDIDLAEIVVFGVVASPRPLSSQMITVCVLSNYITELCEFCKSSSC